MTTACFTWHLQEVFGPTISITTPHSAGHTPDLAQDAVNFTMSTPQMVQIQHASTVTSVSLPTGPQLLFPFVHCKQHVVSTNIQLQDSNQI